ncbi:unnamed protein product [Polarella glacialis]|uniref:Glycerol kinase n=1 Tax=Polarella glacialis TaxID=89957 RepID=A0A813GJ30_POLGL|nr:unnamed protein product [Polarella glacialis]
MATGALDTAGPGLGGTQSCFVGVDVGTGSARAGVFDLSGALLGSAARDIAMRRPRPGHCEQSSEDIWQACCSAVREAVAQALASSAPPLVIDGIAFDATCSLVVLGTGEQPLAVGAEQPDPSTLGLEDGRTYNVIVWCDHRAEQEAEALNASKHRLLDFVGGAVSPEMQMPKLAWLKKHRPKTYTAATRFFDLADYLTYRACDGLGGGSGAGLRSLCTVVCKWNFDASARAWDASFMAATDMQDLGVQRIGDAALDVRDVGSPVPGGLGPQAAAELGLRPGCALAVGVIDAHAGGLGCLGAKGESALETRLALIAGTSACHMASAGQAVHVPGVWGPYDSAMVPGLFLSEGGQSAAGAALDFLIETHAAFPAVQAAAAAAGLKPGDWLSQRAGELAEERGLGNPAFLSAGLFVGPDFSGNRSPLADPRLRGSIVGLGPAGSAQEATSADALTVLYVAAVQALAYSSRAILDAINAARHAHSPRVPAIQAIYACGGLARNELYLQTHADALNLPVHLAEAPAETMLLGSAMLGAAAAGAFASVAEAMRGMGRLATAGGQRLPCAAAGGQQLRKFHDARYEVFLRMQRHQQEYQALERGALGL